MCLLLDCYDEILPLQLNFRYNFRQGIRLRESHVLPQPVSCGFGAADFNVHQGRDLFCAHPEFYVGADFYVVIRQVGVLGPQPVEETVENAVEIELEGFPGPIVPLVFLYAMPDRLQCILIGRVRYGLELIEYVVQHVVYRNVVEGKHREFFVPLPEFQRQHFVLMQEMLFFDQLPLPRFVP